MADPATAVIGKPLPRYESRAKVTGAARYAADFPLSGVAYAYLVPSTIARGRIRAMDLRAATAVPGVLEILTHLNMHDTIRHAGFIFGGGLFADSLRPLQSAEIGYAGQIVAMVLANSFEAAREAAHRLAIQYDAQTPGATFDAPGTVSQPLATQRPRYEDPKAGDFDQAFATAPVTVTARYATPVQHHNPMELFATQCSWDGAQLTIHEATQNLYAVRSGVAEQLGIDAGQVRVINPYIGGAFGGRSNPTQRTAIVAIAARRLGRPVRLVPTRDQGFTLSTYRAETRHEVRLGATRDGRLQALRHDGFEMTSRHDPYATAGTGTTTRMYACRNIASSVTIVRGDLPTPGFMRAPGETPYFFAMECAMDELAVALAMDPVELRRINDTAHEPIRGLPYTTRRLMQCYDAAAAAFGWSRRNPVPGSMRDGDWLIGWGCASAAYPTSMTPASARVTLFPGGTVRVEAGTHEMGNGVCTVIAQTAAELLGIAMDKVTVATGDTQLPPNSVSAGSSTTASMCSVVAQACEGIRRKLSVDGVVPDDLPRSMAQRNLGTIEEYAEWLPDGAAPNARQQLQRGAAFPSGGARLPDRAQYAFGAQFVEVRVHALTREIRVARTVGAFAGGRIMNERLARSQMVSGAIWGIGAALHEATELDPSSARFVNTNLAEYLVPVNADIRDVQVLFVPDEDLRVNPLGIKGIGEVGIVGVNAAIANAVYHATGKRLRALPLRIDNLLDDA